MTHRRLLLPALALALPLLLLLSFRGEEGLYQVYRPSGYIQEVDRLIDEHKLVYDCESEQITAVGLTPAERFFLDNSYLEGDIASWNAGDRSAFVVEREERAGQACVGELEQVSATAHNQRLPTYTVTTWRGRLFVRQGGANVTLGSPERLLEVSRPSWRRLPLAPRAFTDVWLGRDGDQRSERMALKYHEEGRMLAALEHIGDHLTLETVQPRPSIFLDDCEIAPGWRVRLDDGDRLRFAEPEKIERRYVVEAGGAAGLVSFVDTVNGETRRRTLGHRLAMAPDLAQAIDAAVRRAADEPEAEDTAARDDFDVHLTIDAFFQDLLSRRLADFARARYGRRPLRAGVTLLEAETGRVLALASYPGPGDLGALALGRDTDRRLLERNHNFLQHAVGSAAKPFLAAAALATRPELASLRLPCFAGGEPPAEFLGYDFGTYNLPADCGPGGEAPPVGFRRFLELSSNRYMLALGMLAMADWQDGMPSAAADAPALPPRDRFQLGGREQARRPELQVVKDETRPGQTELADVQNEAFFRTFRDLFGHRAFYRSGPVADALATELWRPVLEAAGGVGDRGTALAFSAVTPERVNLKANLIQQLRQDLYTTLLGLGNNRWSNLHLAGSLARLVTGRGVSPELVERVTLPPVATAPEDAAPEVLFDLEDRLAAAAPEPFPLSPEARALILEGMADVVTGAAGTARALAAPLDRINAAAPAGVTYRAVAKTGTPSADLAIVRRGPTAPARDAIEVYSGRPQVKDGVLILALTREAGGESESLSLAFHVEAQGGSEQAVALAVDLVRPLVEAYWPEDWLDAQAP